MGELDGKWIIPQKPVLKNGFGSSSYNPLSLVDESEKH